MTRHERTEMQIEECYNHLENYLEDEECTTELREMCKNAKIIAERPMTLANVKIDHVLDSGLLMSIWNGRTVIDMYEEE